MKRLNFLPSKGRRFLAIDFGHSRVVITHVSLVFDRYKLLHYEIKEVVPKRENEKEDIPNFIIGFIKKNSIRHRDVILSISDLDSVAIKTLILPELPEREIPKAAKWQLKEEVPFDLEEALIEWQILDQFFDNENIKKSRIIFIAIEKRIADRYLSILAQCRLRPLSIVSGFFNFAHLLKTFPKILENVAVLDLDDKDSSLGIYCHSKLNFVRRLPIAMEKLTESLTNVVVTEKGKMELTLQEAKEIENTIGIPLEESQILKDQIEASHIIPLIRPHLETLVREIKSSFYYFTSNFGIERASQLFLTGKGAYLKNLDSYLSKELGIKVSLFPWPPTLEKSVTKNKGLLLPDELKISKCLGATLGLTQGINVLPLDLKTKNVEIFQKALVRIISITLTIVLSFLIFITEFQIKDYQNRLSNAQTQLTIISGIKYLKVGIKGYEELIDKIQYHEIPTHGILKVLSNTIPEEIILDEFVWYRGNAQMILKGKVLTKEDQNQSVLTHFMERLERSQFITDAVLVSSNKGVGIQIFEIRCDLLHN